MMADTGQLRRIESAALRWGFGGSVALTVLVGVTAVVELQMARREVQVLARTADRSSFLVGEIGRELNRLRVAALEHHRDPRASQAEEEFPRIDAALAARVEELRPLLRTQERREWDRFIPFLEHFRHRLRDSIEAVQAGRRHQASVILAHVGLLAEHVQAELDVLSSLNEHESRRLLAAADGRLARVRVVQAIALLVLAIGLALIWSVVLRLLERNRRQLAEYLARIEHSNEDLDAFAARVAHDLRNALAPMTLAAASLRTASQRPEMVVQLAGSVENAVRRSRELIDGLLAFSRPGAVADQHAGASMARAVDDVVEDLRDVALRRGVEIVARTADCEVACPAVLLRMAIANVVGNAVKFLADRPVRRVEIACGPVDGAGEVRISDTGPGIPSHALPRIFEPFYRVPGARASGMGIGLATVRRIVEAHGGRVTVASTPGVGTTFRIRVPLRRDPLAALRAVPEVERTPRPAEG